MTFWRVRCSLYGQCRFAVVAMAFKWLAFKFPMSLKKCHIVNKNRWRIFVYFLLTIALCYDLYKEIKWLPFIYYYYYYYYYYYRYSALGSVSAETRAQSSDRYSSGTLHPGQVPRGRLPYFPLNNYHKTNKCTNCM